LYLLGRTAFGLSGQTEGPVEMSYRLEARLYDDKRGQLDTDEVFADQSIEAATAQVTVAVAALVKR
jgi:hypothetical protein